MAENDLSWMSSLTEEIVDWAATGMNIAKKNNKQLEYMQKALSGIWGLRELVELLGWANKQTEETEARAIRTADDGYQGLYMNAIREIQHAYFYPEDSLDCINRILKTFHSLCMEG